MTSVGHAETGIESKSNTENGEMATDLRSSRM